jgi:hypothetical protein
VLPVLRQYLTGLLPHYHQQGMLPQSPRGPHGKLPRRPVPQPPVRSPRKARRPCAYSRMKISNLPSKLRQLRYIKFEIVYSLSLSCKDSKNFFKFVQSFFSLFYSFLDNIFVALQL